MHWFWFWFFLLFCLHCRDNLVAQGKESKISAAVVFLPQNTLHFGKCGSDKCYCVEVGFSSLPSLQPRLLAQLPHLLVSPSYLLVSPFQMYGMEKEWGCKWFQLWREHIMNAVSLNQRLQVFYFEGLVGKGKIEPTSTMTAWEACREDAMRRDKLHGMKRDFIRALVPREKVRLDRRMSNEARDDSMGEAPGSERSDEEERLFVLSLREDDRCFYERHRGLGNSQKAEVAWLEEMGYDYEEVDVRHFLSATSA
jgi:hypothetical protein